MSVEAELGTLVVVVLKARNLADKHSFYKQDAFAQVILNKTTYRTPVVVKGGQHPVWDAEIRIPIMKDANDKTRMLQVSCWEKERRGDDLLGEGKVDISETLKTGEFDDWVPLMINGAFRGDVYLEMTFFAHHPPQSSSPGVPATVVHKRPSKLSPSDRLWRPSSLTPPRTSPSSSPSRSPEPSKLLQPTSQRTNPPFAAPSPPHSRVSPSPSRKPQEGLLPPLPPQTYIEIPQTLIPGGRRQTPTSRSTSSSPHRQDLTFTPVSPGSSIVYDSVLHSLNLAPQHRPSPQAPPSQHSYTLNQSVPSTSTYSQSIIPAPRPLPSVNVSAQPPDLYHVPGAFPVVSFPVPQRAAASLYDYSDPNDTRVSVPSAPLPYQGHRESKLPNPYSENVYTSPLPPPGSSPRGRQAFDPRWGSQSGFPEGQGRFYEG